MTQFNFGAIGTKWQIDIYLPLALQEEKKIFDAITSRIDEFDKTYSRFRKDSLITAISINSGDYVLPSDAKEIFDLYYSLYLETGGLFTPFVGQILSDAGYDAEYSLKQKDILKSPPNWESMIDFEDPVLHVKKPVLLDFGAGGKGYLIDIVSGVIEKFGILEYCIDAGGDILRKGNGQMRIGLEDPEDTSKAVGVFNLGNGSLCGSAHNRRAWLDFTHIINPVTLSSPKNISAVWVYATSGILADSLATCLFFVNAINLKRKYNFEYLIMYNDRTTEKSDNFDAEIFYGK